MEERGMTPKPDMLETVRAHAGAEKIPAGGLSKATMQAHDAIPIAGPCVLYATILLVVSLAVNCKKEGGGWGGGGWKGEVRWDSRQDGELAGMQNRIERGKKKAGRRERVGTESEVCDVWHAVRVVEEASSVSGGGGGSARTGSSSSSSGGGGAFLEGSMCKRAIARLMHGREDAQRAVFRG